MQTVVKHVIRMSDCAFQAVQELKADCGTGHHVESVGQHVNVTGRDYHHHHLFSFFLKAELTL